MAAQNMLHTEQLMQQRPAHSLVSCPNNTAVTILLLAGTLTLYRVVMREFGLIFMHCRGFRAAAPQVMESVGKWVPADPARKTAELKQPLIAAARKEKLTSETS